MLGASGSGDAAAASASAARGEEDRSWVEVMLEEKSGVDVGLNPSCVLAVRWRRSNSACWSGGRRKGEGLDSKFEAWRACCVVDVLGGGLVLVLVVGVDGSVVEKHRADSDDVEGRMCERVRDRCAERAAILIVSVGYVVVFN